MNTPKPMPPEQRTDDDLVQLCLELYARTGMYPDSEDMHDAAFAAIAVLKKRLADRRPNPETQAACPRCDQLRKAYELANHHLSCALEVISKQLKERSDPPEWPKDAKL